MKNELNIDYSKIKTHKDADAVLAGLADKGVVVEIPEGATVKAKVEAIKKAVEPTPPTDGPEAGSNATTPPTDASEPEEVVTPKVQIYRNKIVIRSEVKIMHGKTYMELGFDDGTTDVIPKDEFLTDVITK